MALGEVDQARKLARAALAAQPELSLKYVRSQEWYRDGAVLEQLAQRLIAAGVPERVEAQAREGASPEASNIVL